MNSGWIEEPGASAYGGDWSDKKLLALSKYLSAYTTALKNTKFSLIYIDAFAGAGRQDVSTEQEQHQSSLIEMEEVKEDEKQYRHGSPFVALAVSPPFDRFIFIDKDEQSLQNLAEQVLDENYSAKSIDYLAGDANEQLEQICHSTDWKSHRAVIFVDPFAMEVKWETLDRIANTRAIDLWLLFPAMAVNRMLTTTGEIPPQWQEKLTECFGTDEWREVFYQPSDQQSLLEDEPTVKVPKPFEILSTFVNKRLKTIFPGVINRNLILTNSRNSPLFLLCFACANPNPQAYRLAIKIANQIIGTSQ